MGWVAVLFGSAFLALSVSALLDPKRWAEGIHSAQQRRLGPFAPRDDDLTRQGFLGADTASSRVAGIRFFGIAGIVVSVLFVVVSVLL